MVPETQTVPTFVTREEWLEEAIRLLAPLFPPTYRPTQGEHAGEDRPIDVASMPVHVSIGFPAGRPLSRKNRAIGQCWTGKVSDDGIPHVFVSPILGEPRDLLSTLLHEVVHAVVGTEEGHKGAFRKVAIACGFTPPMRSTPTTPELEAFLDHVLTELGPIPHSTLNADEMTKKKQTTRMLKAVCPACGYTVRLAKKWAVVGMPLCPCGPELVLDVPPDGEGDGEEGGE